MNRPNFSHDKCYKRVWRIGPYCLTQREQFGRETGNDSERWHGMRVPFNNMPGMAAPPRGTGRVSKKDSEGSTLT